MGIRRLYGTGTVDAGVFWDECVSEKGWRIQHNKTLEVTGMLKPYRLLDPKGNLWASSDTLSEMANALPELAASFSEKEPLFGSEEAKCFVKAVFIAAGTALTDAAIDYIKSKK
ncbi:hypothetical protein KQ940_20930 [Marinobacterium sp. D7]|uniref:hypothetical protein n=1 Tax=Marinobacterium ramblicola TaxID=2849041 RepID=UPI001C2CDB19|nr:hypothetical protein [Marinobacterium ramblicola]MBV1790532.1 hypothetical protein [Marinobacterium ramblicola]